MHFASEGTVSMSQLHDRPPNNSIKLSARSVTHLASARCALVRAAAYRLRSA